MKKTLIVSLIVVALLCTMVFMFTACDMGKYENSDIGYVNLKIGGKFSAEMKSLTGGTTEYKGTYEVAKEADDKGNRTVTFKNEKGEGMLAFGVCWINADGVLIVNGAKFVK